MTDRPFSDPDSQRRLDRLLERLRAHCRAAVAKGRRSELRLLLIVDARGTLARDSRIDPPAEFAE